KVCCAITQSKEAAAVTQQQTTGAETVRWDLNDLYRDIDDAALDADVERLVALAKRFFETFAGKLATKLGDALNAQAEITCVADKLFVYLHLRRSTDATNERIQQRAGAVQEAWSRASADYLTFFEHELVAIDDATYAAIIKRDTAAARHVPLLDHIRANRRF